MYKKYNFSQQPFNIALLIKINRYLAKKKKTTMIISYELLQNPTVLHLTLSAKLYLVHQNKM